MTRYFVYTMYPDNPVYFVFTLDNMRGLIWQGGRWSEPDNTRFVDMMYSGDVYLDEIPESDLPAGVDPI